MIFQKNTNKPKRLNFKNFVVPFCLLLVLSPSNIYCFAKTVVTIDNIVQELDEKTSCDIQFWANKLENSCKCCLIKHTPELKTKKAKEILNSCIKEKQCSEAVIVNLIMREKFPSSVKDEESKLKYLLNTLYDRSVLIKEVETKEISFDQAGNFNENSVANFLAKAYREKKLTNADFQEASCLKAKDIIGQKGYQTKQLFLVTSTCTDKSKPVDYIFKEIASGTAEILRLEKSILVPELAPYIYPKIVSGFPSFIFPIAYISYNYNNIEHYLSLMLKSPGFILSSLIEDFKNGTKTQAEIEEAFYQTGKAFGTFHVTFMNKFKSPGTTFTKTLNPTFIHGDSHQGNIFYDKKTKQVLFIDNEKIASSSPGDPWSDIRMFIFTTLDLFTAPHLREDSKFINNWLLITIKSFLKGYIDAYTAIQNAKKIFTFDIPTLKNKILNEIETNMKKDNHYQNYKNTIDSVFKQLKG